MKGRGALRSGSTITVRGAYSTSFDADENPISEGGAWVNGAANGGNWNNIRALSGAAIGVAISPPATFDDNIAHLSGTWAADQSAEGVVYKAGGYAPGFNHEIELLLRFAITSGNARGYEILVQSQGGYSYVVRWNGSRGDYTIIGAAGIGTPADGDVIKATAVGSTITVYKNAAQVAQYTDATWATGAPGVGIYAESGATLANFGWKSFSAAPL